MLLLWKHLSEKLCSAVQRQRSPQYEVTLVPGRPWSNHDVTRKDNVLTFSPKIMIFSHSRGECAKEILSGN